jgi:hypothetical protein
MRRYEVIHRTPDGTSMGTVVVPAVSPSDAVVWARCLVGSSPGATTFAVYRRRRVRGRRFMGLFAGPGGEDGTAGVREPRRPLPAPPSLHAEAGFAAYTEH